MATDSEKLSTASGIIHKTAIAFAAIVTFGSGIVNINSVVGYNLPRRMALLYDAFPLEFIHLSRSLVLLIGFVLVVSAFNIYKRKKNAFFIVTSLALVSIIFHLTNGLNYEEASVSLFLAATLLITRRRFIVQSNVPSLFWTAIGLSVALVTALCYGVAGFWFLDASEFHREFHFFDAVQETLLSLAFIGDNTLVPHTRHAVWFLNSLTALTAATVLYGVIVVFRPVYYLFRVRPQERIRAKSIVVKFGKSSLDFFKYWPDKSFYFSPSNQTVVAYRVGANFALALGDPVGPDNDIESAITGFSQLCREQDWRVGFHQTLPDYIALYEKLGFKKVKIGDDAVTDLGSFTLEGRSRKELRYTVNHFQALGITFTFYDPPVPDSILLAASEVSDDWLKIPGRRERQFTLGAFEPDFVRSTPLAAAYDTKGEMLGFVNQIPSYCKGEATVDLMRRRRDAPNDTMNYLFVKLLLLLKEKGYQKFNFGMAPMAGFQENEPASAEERIIHAFFKNLNFLFSYQGLKHFKAKFATSWEPRYIVVKSILDLPQYLFALRKVSEVPRIR
jgi:phosphatidylglycerol lysyltransferase